MSTTATIPATVVHVGDYLINQQTAVMVEVLEVDEAGNAMVTDVRHDSDKPQPVRLRACALRSTLWRRMDHAATTEAA